MSLLDSLLAPPLPSIGLSLLILIAGFITGRIMASFINRIARKSGFRGKMKSGLEHEAGKFGIDIDMVSVSALMVKYSVYLIAVLFAMELVGLRAATLFLGLALPYLPHVFAAILILLFGSAAVEIAADVMKFGLRDHLDDAARAAGFSKSISTTIASALRFFLYLFIFLMALIQLGFRATALLDLLMFLMLIIAGVGAVLLILFVRTHLDNLSAWFYLKSSEGIKVGDRITIGRISGMVEKIGGINTTISNGDGKFFVPNHKFVQETFTITKK